MTPQDMQALGERVLAAQPFSRFLGARLDRFVEGEAQLSLALRPEFLQQHGRPHGGILSYLADNALTFAGGSLYGDGLTLEFKINYTKAAKGDTLVARARVESSGRQAAVCRCDLFSVAEDGSETLCAVAQGTIMAPATSTG
jgi:acyl-CoA thioesterase